MRIIGRVFLAILAAIGSLALVVVALGAWTAFSFRPEPLPKRLVLQLDFDEGVIETEPESPFGRLGAGGAYVMTDVVEALDRAAHDPRVTGLVARIGNPSLGMGRVQELRDAVEGFKKSGKRTVVYSSSLGEFGGATLPFYLASAFKEIWLQPSGDVALTGFLAESPFLKGSLDMLGITPQFGARYEYKSAIEPLTRTGFSDEGRQSLTLLLDSWTRQVVAGIAASRTLQPEAVTALIDHAPLLAAEAKAAGLVDRLAYWDELESELTADDTKLVDLADYAAHRKTDANAVKVALIFGVGAVQQGDGGTSGEVMASERVTKALRDAVKDPGIKAILFRINSPGGSYTASDAIWREVGKARAAGKPVVVSMSDVAASGGYFAAMAADRIVAQPGTITGSIGVFAGKFVLADLWKKLGVTWDAVQKGENAAMWSANKGFSPAAWARVNTMLDHIYGDFTEKAEKNRNITPESMDGIARGRIWPGEDAVRLGLVDRLGGYPQAFALLRELARLPSQMPLALVEFPRQKAPVEYLSNLLRKGRLPAEMGTALAIGGRLDQFLTASAPFTALLANQGLLLSETAATVGRH